MADVHCRLDGRDEVRRLLDGVAEEARAVVLAGDLTDTGRPAEMEILLSAIARGAIGPPHDRELAGILAGDSSIDPFAAAWPDATVLGSVGAGDRVLHAGVIARPRRGGPFVLVILTAGFEDVEESIAVLRAVIKAVAAHRPVR